YIQYGPLRQFQIKYTLVFACSSGWNAACIGDLGLVLTYISGLLFEIFDNRRYWVRFRFRYLELLSSTFSIEGEGSCGPCGCWTSSVVFSSGVSGISSSLLNR